MREDEPDAQAVRTEPAQKGATLADEVSESFEGFKVGGGDYVVELLEPEGAPIGDGKQSLQHLRLRPRRAGFSVVVAANVHSVEKWAELRTFEHASITHDLHFDKSLDITPREWEELLRRAEEVLHRADIETGRVGPSPALLRDARRKKGLRKISPRALAIFLVVTLLAAGVVFRVVQTLLAKE